MRISSVIATHAGEPHLFGWYVGLAIGFAVVLILVVVVAAILTYAARINQQAQSAIQALEAARVTTLPLWEVEQTNASLRAILQSARTARQALGG